VNLFPDRFYAHDLKKGKSIFVGRLLYSTDDLYKFCDSIQPKLEPTTLISHSDERSLIWHERLRNLNF
jgi:hypothetical protein